MATEAPTLRRTPLYDKHVALGAKIVPFAGYEMPIQYEGIVAEHRAVRSAAGLFDLSHMGEFGFRGRGAGALVDRLVSSDIAGLAVGQARYGLLTNDRGTIVDDVIVYRTAEAEYLMVVNAANIAKDRAHVLARLGEDVAFDDRSFGTALVAIQGPRAVEILASQTDADVRSLSSFGVTQGRVASTRATLARTGYTGEDGFEVFCRPEDAVPIWEALTAGGAGADSGAGLVPAGLAARDTLRLEAGMPLYGNELGPDVTPFEAGLGRVVKFDKPGEFVGREALAARASSGPVRRLAGLTVQSRRIARHGYPVLADGKTCGTVTSGAPSPTLAVPIAMAYLEPGAAGDDRVLAVGIRGEQVPVQLTDLPFYRRRQ